MVLSKSAMNGDNEGVALEHTVADENLSTSFGDSEIEVFGQDIGPSLSSTLKLGESVSGEGGAIGMNSTALTEEQLNPNNFICKSCKYL